MIRKEMQCVRQTEQDPTSSENQYGVHSELWKAHADRQPMLLDQLPAPQLDSLGQTVARPLDLVWALKHSEDSVRGRDM